MDYDPKLPLPGQRRLPRYWFIWAWSRAMAAMLVVVVVGFLGTWWAGNDYLVALIQRGHSPQSRPVTAIASDVVGLDITAPLHVQLAEYAADVFLYPPVLTVLALSGAFAVGMTWYRRR